MRVDLDSSTLDPPLLFFSLISSGIHIDVVWTMGLQCTILVHQCIPYMILTEMREFNTGILGELFNSIDGTVYLCKWIWSRMHLKMMMVEEKIQGMMHNSSNYEAHILEVVGFNLSGLCFEDAILE
ncbi:uncharacterized protein [Spinacia oleracea]|uniref:Uncharacterized protein n=1 Tax=Spinacia oleracea TaxID=3562 RepID=A0ABM3QIV6_SPIOL|nr:uncharacterized protein LOC130459768 [Spinacia oleracea]